MKPPMIVVRVRPRPICSSVHDGRCWRWLVCGSRVRISAAACRDAGLSGGHALQRPSPRQSDARTPFEDTSGGAPSLDGARLDRARDS